MCREVENCLKFLFLVEIVTVSVDSCRIIIGRKANDLKLDFSIL